MYIVINQKQRYYEIRKFGARMEIICTCDTGLVSDNENLNLFTDTNIIIQIRNLYYTVSVHKETYIT